MQRCIQHHPANPRRAAIDNLESCPQAIFVFHIAHLSVVCRASIKHPKTHDYEHDQEADEEFMIFRSDAISNPRTAENEKCLVENLKTQLLTTYW